MHSSFRKYVHLFSAYWSTTMQYRGDFYMWGIAQSVSPLISLAIWYTVATTADIALTPQQTLAYFTAVIFLNNIIHGPDGFLFGEDILQGKLVQHLMKPYQSWLSYLIRGLEIRFVFILILLPILLLLAVVAPQLFAGLVLKPATLLLFACSALLGIGVFFVFDMFLATTAFWFEE